MVDIVIVRSNFVEPMGVVDEVLNLHVYCVADPGNPGWKKKAEPALGIKDEHHGS